MMHYLVDRYHDEPLSWRDVEALPIVAFALLLVIAVARMQQELAPALSGEFVKALALVFLLGARKLLGDIVARADDPDDAEDSALAIEAAPAE
ncbi:hypothetical protein [Sphingomonas sp. BK235]|jgi:hypothetical protein|uniref:hypothetical protein n=1 Tax=Sphingomonas sp. BK235 TaxID=2512131 RepID=UPI0010463259|nr:hypothetical protein [Sphingomonas sp. BK235]TCP34604.1 hypothetical protein EV292_10329 [Sphingomonas sp. BK235]